MRQRDKSQDNQRGAGQLVFMFRVALIGAEDAQVALHGT